MLTRMIEWICETSGLVQHGYTAEPSVSRVIPKVLDLSCNICILTMGWGHFCLGHSAADPYCEECVEAEDNNLFLRQDEEGGWLSFEKNLKIATTLLLFTACLVRSRFGKTHAENSLSAACKSNLDTGESTQEPVTIAPAKNRPSNMITFYLFCKISPYVSMYERLISHVQHYNNATTAASSLLRRANICMIGFSNRDRPIFCA